MRVNQFRYSVGLLERNYAELHSFASHLTSALVAHELGALENRWRQREAMREVLYLLHDYTAAAQSLVDHSRVVFGHLYRDTELVPDYQTEIDGRFISHPLSQFVVGLRQMAQHYRLPTIGITHSFRNTPAGGVFEARLVLKRSDLEEFGGWKAPAKEFLSGQQDEINLLSLVEAYHAHVMDFHAWFRNEQVRVHGRGPDLLNHVALHGTNLPSTGVVAALTKSLEELERREPSTLRFSDLYTAFEPVLTDWDFKVLNFYEHNPGAWIERAIRVARDRFSIPTDLEDRYSKLVRP